jgi:hypothetical protein
LIDRLRDFLDKGQAMQNSGLKYTDGEIVAARREQREKTCKDIYGEEVWANGEEFHFSSVELFDCKLSVMLPDSFVDMPEALQKIKYPMEKRPSIIKSNIDTSINFAFSLHDIAFNANLVKEAMGTYVRGLVRMYPGIRFLNTETVPIGGTLIGYFDFLSKGIDTDIYQVFAFMPLEGRMLQLIFNSPGELMAAWNPIVLQVVASMREIKRDEV